MVPLERGMELHGRTCRGDKLTAAEIAERDAWYAQMDAEEFASLDLRMEEHPTVEELRQQLREEWDKIAEVVREIQELDSANEKLRQQNEELKRKLLAKGVLVS